MAKENWKNQGSVDFCNILIFEFAYNNFFIPRMKFETGKVRLKSDSCLPKKMVLFTSLKAL